MRESTKRERHKIQFEN